MSSEEVATAYGDMRAQTALRDALNAALAENAALESQLGQAHEQIAILEAARADFAALRTAVAAYLSATAYAERGRRFRQLRDLMRGK